MDSRWQELVKNLGDYESGYRKPQGQPRIDLLTIDLLTIIYHKLRKTNIPFYEQIVPHKVYLS